MLRRIAIAVSFGLVITPLASAQNTSRCPALPSIDSLGRTVADSLAQSVYWDLEGQVDVTKAQAVARIRDAQLRGPLNVETWRMLRDLLRFLIVVDSGITIAREGLVRWPNCMSTQIGLLWLREIKYRDSLRTAGEHLTEAFPQAAVAWAARAEVATRTGDLRAAAEYFKRALALDSNIFYVSSFFSTAYERARSADSTLPALRFLRH